jgi:hypothetical protein
MNKRQYHKMKGMLEVAYQQWTKIPLEKFQNAFKSWPMRVLAIYKDKGKHASKYIEKKNLIFGRFSKSPRITLNALYIYT